MWKKSKMNRSTGLVMVLCIFLQIYQAFPYSIEEEYQLKYLQVKKKIETLLQEHTEALLLARMRQKNLVATGQQSLREELEQLKQYIKETAVEAESKSVDISTCLKIVETENSLERLSDRINDLEICQSQTSLEFLQNELNYFLNQHQNFNEMVSACVESEENVTFGTSPIDGRHPCVDNNISEIELRILLVNQISNTLVENGYNGCLKCVRYQLDLVDKDILSFARKYVTCVDAKLSNETTTTT